MNNLDRALLNGGSGPGPALAMGLLVKLAEVSGATTFVDIESAHIDGCLYHGQVGIDFVRALLQGGASVSVPTTLNVSSLDLLHPELYRGPEAEGRAARKLMDLHVDLGCKPTWTCAPYQLPDRPALGSHIAWGESNAIVFANSVLGARTNRYGDFADLACAVTGRAPFSGFHTDEGRKATVVVDLDVSDELLDADIFYPLLGLWLGANTGSRVAAVCGLPTDTSEDRLKALGASAASSGATALFHGVGVTPESPTLEAVLAAGPVSQLTVGPGDLARTRERLGTATGKLGAVSVGTPHMSAAGFAALGELTAGSKSRVPFYVNTGRDVLEGLDPSLLGTLEDFGVTIVTDTCTYITPVMGDVNGPVMTDSGKWAYYAPANLGVEVVFAGLAECVESAASGRIELSEAFL